MAIVVSSLAPRTCSAVCHYGFFKSITIVINILNNNTTNVKQIHLRICDDPDIRLSSFFDRRVKIVLHPGELDDMQHGATGMNC